jgi:hypothetical protein
VYVNNYVCRRSVNFSARRQMRSGANKDSDK